MSEVIEVTILVIPNPLFQLGKIVITERAMKTFNTYGGTSPEQLIALHVSGDWGDMPESDKALNDEAVKNGGKISSRYLLMPKSLKIPIWVITEWDRSATTILLPDED